MSAEAPRCLVIGGSGSIGFALCMMMTARGAQVALTYHAGEATVTRHGARAIRVDLARANDVERAVDEAAAKLGGLDALVYCAAVGISEPMAAIDEAAWDRLMAINLKSAFFACRRAASIFGDRGGNLVLVGSVDGVKPAPSAIHYATSKAALGGMVRAMAKEVGPRNVRVNLVAPGILDDGLSRALPAAIRQDYLDHCAARRFGRLDEAAAVIAWLALDNTYVTGQTWVVDGAL